MQELCRALTSPDNNVRTAAEAQLNRYRVENYTGYVSDLITLLEQGGPQSQEREFACLYLYKEGKDKAFFSNMDLVKSVAVHLMQLYPVLLASGDRPNFKKLVGSMLAMITNFLYIQMKSTDIQQAMLKLLSEHSEFEIFIVDYITQLVVSADECAGLTAETIQAIVSRPTNQTNFISTFQLFLAFCTRTGDGEELHRVFMLFWENLPQDVEIMSEFLKAIADFGEAKADFFFPHLSVVIPTLCKLAMNTSAPKNLRAKVLLFFTSLAECQPKMCRGSPDFYGNVVLTLVILAGEDPDEEVSPDEYDPNDDSISSAAVEAMKIILESCAGPEACEIVFRFKEQQMAGEQVPWNVTYGFLQFLAQSREGSLLVRDQVLSKGVAMELLQHAQPQNVLKVRVTALMALSTVLQILGGNVNSDDWTVPIVEALLIIDNENVPVMSEEVYALFSGYIKCWDVHAMDTQGVRLYEHILRRLPDVVQRNDMRSTVPNMLALVGVLADRIGGAVVKTFPALIEILDRILTVPDLSLQISAILVRAGLMKNPYAREQMICLSENLLNAIMTLRQNDNIDDRDVDNLNRALLIVLTYGQLSGPTYARIAQMYLQLASVDVEVMEVGLFQDFDVSRSVWEKIPTEKTGVRCYVDTNDVHGICHALAIVDACQLAQEWDSSELVKPILEVTMKWLMGEHIIHQIYSACFQLLVGMFRLHPSPELFSEIIKTIGFLTKPGHSGYFVMNQIESLRRLLAIVNAKIPGTITDENAGLMILTTIETVASQFEKRCVESVSEIETYNPQAIEDEDDFEESVGQRDVFRSLSDLLEQTFLVFGPLAQGFFAERMAPHLMEMLGTPNMVRNSLNLLTVYICGCGLKVEARQMIGFIMQKLQPSETPPMWAFCLQQLGALLGHFQFDSSEQEEAERINDFFDKLSENVEQLLSEREEQEDRTETRYEDITDYGLVAYTKFVRVYYENDNDIFDSETLIRTWWGVWPLWQNPEEHYLVFDFLATVLEDGNLDWLMRDGPDEVLMERFEQGWCKIQLGRREGQRLCEVFKTFWATPELQARMAVYLEGHPERREFWAHVLRDPQFPEMLPIIPEVFV